MDIRAIITAMIVQVAAEQARPIKELDNSLSLTDSGLNSLCLAVIVAKLEDELGVDPFSADLAVPFPRTIGDLISCYEHALI
jgi:acyl carrier protein